ncbi:helix-turn-helix transcriptional regulator [Flavobacterium sp. '19STA2R22 D10 B1']|uniref:helix-turn-helix transcriptional regulator n=1 Tax=Flavobacterium aerium TaxID=3037261 RepID=UPI00278C677E|nr:AraC family transcriptional regulator [Flavobacterium sp. '19STA2R22 D10 B1']
MHFVLSGNTKMINTAGNETLTFEKFQHNLVYTNGVKNNWEWESNDDLKLFEVYIKIDFFKKYICENESYLKPFTSAVKNKTNAVLAKENLTITPEMYTTIENIVNCNRKGAYKKMFFEAQIIQLLLLQLEQVCCNNCAIKCSLKKSDINKMHQVKEIMLSNLNSPHTLLELAHQVGTNEFTLKKGFKTIFGNTVFGYLNDAKMAKAQKMLIEQGLSVTQVAEQVGYKNATHFTTAFKKKYGILPSTLKNEIKN